MSVGGVKVRISLFTLPFVGIALWLGQADALALAFPFVTAHEMAHVAAARAMGQEVESVELTPFGGVARVESLAGAPAFEAVIALAGPAVSLLLAMGAVFAHRYMPFAEDTLREVVRVNLCLCAFNLLPVLPLDGGRVLRAGLSPVVGVERATRITGIAGCAAGGLLLALGIWGAFLGAVNATLLLAGLAMIFLAREESRLLPGRLALYMDSRRRQLERRGELPVRRVAVLAGESAARAARRALPREMRVFEVLDEKMRPLGDVPEGRVLEELMRGGGGTTMRELVANGSPPSSR